MRRARLPTIGALLATCALLAAALAGIAGGATVRVGALVLRADGGFAPRLLPKRTYAPIRFQGHAEIDTTNGAPPPPLKRVRLDFDRDGRLTTAGLPTCSPSTIEGSSPTQARRACARALVGTGHVRAAITLPGRDRVDVTSPLSLFNGPRQDGDATVLAHAQTTFPSLQTYVMVVPVERLRSRYYGYRATLDLPEIAGGYGALTHIDAKVGRRYRAGGAERSYISARCSDSILETIGYVSFADGTVISGTIFKPCRPRP
jgi:hypothetical protein